MPVRTQVVAARWGSSSCARGDRRRFRCRAQVRFASCGVEVERVLTDSGSGYRSRAFAEALGPITHQQTRPYRSQTGKVERFNRTVLEE
jgi:transposase InsO family protein